MPIEDLHIFYTAECCIASINTLATSGRENSRGGISPICSIWRTLGAALAACAAYLHEHPGLTNVVCIVADSGDNYTDSIYSDEWIQKHGLDLSMNHLGPVQDIQYTLTKPAYSVSHRRRQE